MLRQVFWRLLEVVEEKGLEKMSPTALQPVQEVAGKPDLWAWWGQERRSNGNAKHCFSGTWWD